MEGEDRDARRVAEHFERLARPGFGDAAGQVAGDPAEAELEAATVLLALALDPVPPRPELRQRLLAALAVPAAPVPAAAPAVVPVAASPVAAAPVQVVAAQVVAAQVVAAQVVDLADFVRRERRVVRAVRLLVAALLLCLIGVVYLTARLDRQGAELHRQSAELDTVGRRMHMITSVARYAYRLETVEPTLVSAFAPQSVLDSPPQGMVYVCGHHQQWILSLEHLPPPPPDREYHIQFRTDSGVIDGGVLRVDAKARAGMEDVKLPPGTRGFSVTLEPVGSAGDPLLVLQSQPGVPL